MTLWKLIPISTAMPKDVKPGFFARLFGAKTIIYVDQPVIYLQQPEPLDSLGFIIGDAVKDKDQSLYYVTDIVENNYTMVYHATNLTS